MGVNDAFCIERSRKDLASKSYLEAKTFLERSIQKASLLFV